MKKLYLLPPLNGHQKFWCECGHVVQPIMTAECALNTQYFYGCKKGHAVQIKDETLGEFIEIHDRFYEPIINNMELTEIELNNIINGLLVAKSTILIEDPTTDFVSNDIVVDFENKDTGEKRELSLSQIVALRDIVKLQQSSSYMEAFNYYRMSKEVS